jgi:hypothetical protein
VPFAPEKELPLDDCAICRHLGTSPRKAAGSVGLLTSIEAIVNSAAERLDDGGGAAAHVLVPTCPEHAVDVYRGRVEGVAMAWKFAAVPVTPVPESAPRSRGGASASPA